MNQGRRGEEVFEDDRDFELFLALLHEAHELYDCQVAAYCLMPNHYHLLIKTPSGNLSRIMRHVNGVYTQRYNRKKMTVNYSVAVIRVSLLERIAICLNCCAISTLILSGEKSVSVLVTIFGQAIGDICLNQISVPGFNIWISRFHRIDQSKIFLYEEA